MTDSDRADQWQAMPALSPHAPDPASVANDLVSGPTPPSFDALYAAEFGWVHRTLRRLGARERDIEDLAHDVFVVVYRALPKFEAGRPLKPWLFGIAFRVVSDYRRRSRFAREQLSEDEPVAPIDSDGAAAGDPERAASQAQDRALVLRALATLPLDQRAVFVAHEIDGTSIPELQESLGLSINTLYSRLRLARAKFASAVLALRPTDDRRTR